MLGAYEHLLSWHRDWYVDNDPEKHARRRNPPLYRGLAGDWRLTTAEKKRILLNNIYGVDIDPQAVEVTKLSLLLRVLEGESGETITNQLRVFHERALPDLGGNIKCGNSLIGPDFYNGHQLSLFSDDERYRINVFDWHDRKHGFGAVMAAGGFDAVIGNPPYVRMEAFKDAKDYLREHYCCHDERSDLYVYFLERDLAILRKRGRLGIIVSNKFRRANYGRNIRSLITRTANLERIVDLAGLRVFAKPTVRTIVLLAEKGGSTTAVQYSPPPTLPQFQRLHQEGGSLALIADPLAYEVPVGNLASGDWDLSDDRQTALLKKLAEGATPLTTVVGGKVCRGVVSGLTEAFVISVATRKKIVTGNKRATAIIHPFLQGRSVRRYAIEPSDECLIYTHHGIDMGPYPAVLRHLETFRKRLLGRATKQAWYELQQPQYAYVDYMAKPKIVFPDIATECRFALDQGGHFVANTVYFLPTNDLRLLGLLNSRLALFYFQQTCAALEGPAKRLPAILRPVYRELSGATAGVRKEKGIASINGSGGRDNGDVHEERAARTAHEKTVLERQIAAADRQIDLLVYELYGLTDEEIAIVEQARAIVSIVGSRRNREVESGALSGF